MYLSIVLCFTHVQSLYVFLTEHEEFDFSEDMDRMVWNEDIVYGSWYDGPNKDGTWTNRVTVPVPEQVQNNGSWFIHVFATKKGRPLNPDSKGYSEQAITYQYKCRSYVSEQ